MNQTALLLCPVAFKAEGSSCRVLRWTRNGSLSSSNRPNRVRLSDLRSSLRCPSCLYACHALWTSIIKLMSSPLLLSVLILWCLNWTLWIKLLQGHTPSVTPLVFYLWYIPVLPYN